MCRAFSLVIPANRNLKHRRQRPRDEEATVASVARDVGERKSHQRVGGRRAVVEIEVQVAEAGELEVPPGKGSVRMRFDERWERDGLNINECRG